jgi:hypothetical protein
MKGGLAALVALMLMAGVAGAQERVTLGWGRMFSNDGIGDGQDRWRTGAYTVSRVRGPDWTGALPDTFGEILEFRFRADIIAPSNLTAPAPGDRRYAGVLSFGLHTHFDWKGLDTSLGADLVVTGPQTGLGRLQTEIHELLDAPIPMVLGNQIADGVHPTLVAEVGRSFELGGGAVLRPYAEAQAGLETFVRFGADFSLGGYDNGALMLRETTTGQRYRAVAGDIEPGFSFTLGGDIAHVWDSVLLPETGAAELSEERHRLRAGVAWQGARGAAVFYGLTYLSPEFEGQSEGQFIGSLNVNLNF